MVSYFHEGLRALEELLPETRFKFGKADLRKADRLLGELELACKSIIESGERGELHPLPLNISHLLCSMRQAKYPYEVLEAVESARDAFVEQYQKYMATLR